MGYTTWLELDNARRRETYGLDSMRLEGLRCIRCTSVERQEDALKTRILLNGFELKTQKYIPSDTMILDPKGVCSYLTAGRQQLIFL